jgi:ATP-binding cassette subfamily F protein 3
VEALTEYGGAVILVSHDPHRVELVADRLWLVKGGHVRPFDDDMDAYRRLLLSERGGTTARPRDDKPKPRPQPRSDVAPLKAEAAKCEARVAKLEEMRAAIDSRLANPLIYTRGDTEAIERLRRKRAEVEDALTRAEALWMTALERLDAAGERV